MNKDFFRGVLVCACAISLIQDIMGQDRYISFLQSGGWCPSWISLPIAMLLLFYVYYGKAVWPYDEKG